jgi:hypothetical protein
MRPLEIHPLYNPHPLTDLQATLYAKSRSRYHNQDATLKVESLISVRMALKCQSQSEEFDRNGTGWQQ